MMKQLLRKKSIFFLWSNVENTIKFRTLKFISKQVSTLDKQILRML